MVSINNHQPSHPKPQKIKITNTLLYGIFVSQKSYLIGLRNLIKRDHAEMLADKIIGNILPQELIDIVVDFLHEMDQGTVRAKWNPARSATEENVRTFENGVYDSPAFRNVSAKLASFKISTTPIQTTRPLTGRGTVLSDPPYTTYIHLSPAAPAPQPSLALSISPKFSPPDPVSPAIFYNAGNALVRVKLRKDDSSRGVRHMEEATYMPCVGSVESREEPRGMGRLLQGVGVEEAVRGWDGESVRVFVEVLGLRVVPFDEGDSMKPGLHVWQRIGEEGCIM